jgi:hypothetical protein
LDPIWSCIYRRTPHGSYSSPLSGHLLPAIPCLDWGTCRGRRDILSFRRSTDRIYVPPSGEVLATARRAGRDEFVYDRRLAVLAFDAIEKAAQRKSFLPCRLIDVHIPTTDGRELILTRYTQPEPELTLLVEKLRLQLPDQPPPKITAALPHHHPPCSADFCRLGTAKSIPINGTIRTIRKRSMVKQGSQRPGRSPTRRG